MQVVAQALGSNGSLAVDLTDVAPQGCQGNVAGSVGATSTSAATSGSPAILELGGAAYVKFSVSYLKSAGASASIDLSDYNARVTITASPAGEVVDGSQFGF